MLSRIAVIIELILMRNILSSHLNPHKSLIENEILMYRDTLKTSSGSNLEPIVLMGLGTCYIADHIIFIFNR